MERKPKEGKERKPIRAETKRNLLVECGHQCSVIGCHERSDLVSHHINFDPSDNKESNIIVLCPNHAAMADKGKIDRKACRLYKKRLKEISRKVDASLKELVEREGVYRTPEHPITKFLIDRGRRYVMWKYHRPDASLNKEIAVLMLLAVPFSIPFLYDIYRIFTEKKPFGNLISIALLVAPAIFLGIVTFIIRTRCPDCKGNFGIRRVDSREIPNSRKEIYRDENVITIETICRNLYRCGFCSYEDPRNERIRETIQIS